VDLSKFLPVDVINLNIYSSYWVRSLVRFLSTYNEIAIISPITAITPNIIDRVKAILNRERTIITQIGTMTIRRNMKTIGLARDQVVEPISFMPYLTKFQYYLYIYTKSDFPIQLLACRLARFSSG
jgi:hypothetical protein